MVGNDAERTCCFGIITIVLAGKLADARKYVCKGIRVIDALRALKRCNRAFKTHARVNVFLFKHANLAVCGLEVLHENIVPDFKIFAAIACGAAFIAAFLFACIEENFGIGAAGTARSGNPPVMFCVQEEDVTRISTHFNPAIARNLITRGALIALKTCEIKPVRIDAEPFFIGQEFPTPCDRLLLK